MSTLAGWNAQQWMTCNGSVQMQTAFPALPGEVSESRREGLACHEITQLMLESFKDPNEGTLIKSDVVGMTASNGVLVTEEMGQACLDATTSVIMNQPLGGNFELMQIEQRLDLSFIHPELNMLKPDCYIWDESTGIIDVWDFKFGRRVVEVFENWQLILYALGIINKYEINGHADQHVRVRMRIFQPFAAHVDGVDRVWECPASDLRAYANKLIEGAKQALGDSPSCTPGATCTYCTGRRGCETLQRSNGNIMDYIGNAVPFEMEGLNLSTEYNLLKHFETMLKARLTGIEEQVIHDIKSGKIVPGLGTKQGYGRKAWRKDIDQEEVIMMGDLMDVDLRKPRELDTPAKCLSKGVDEAVIDEYSFRPTGKMKIVKNDETKARNVFR